MEQILKDFQQAWIELDAELIIKHLDPSFRYDSQWIFDSLDYNGYIEYIKGKFLTLKNNRIQIEASIIDDNNFGGKMLKLNQNGNFCYYRIKVAKDKVIKGDLCMF